MCRKFCFTDGRLREGMGNNLPCSTGDRLYIFIYMYVCVCMFCLFVISSMCGCLTESSEELSALKVALSVELR